MNWNINELWAELKNKIVRVRIQRQSSNARYWRVVFTGKWKGKQFNEVCLLRNSKRIKLFAGKIQTAILSDSVGEFIPKTIDLSIVSETKLEKFKESGILQ